MSLASCLRRSVSRFASLSGTRINQLRSISAVVTRRSSVPPPNQSPLRPFGFLFSTAIDRSTPEQSLLRVIDSEINSAVDVEDLDLENFDPPGNFPFRIEDNPGHQSVSLSREYNEEHVKIVVGMPSLDADDDSINDDDDDDDDRNGSSIPLVVTVTKKKSGLSLEFSCIAFPDKIEIDSLSVNHPENSSDDQMANEGPPYEDLDENLRNTFHKFLEIRGVKASTTNFLHEYMMGKEKREYLLWLENVKKFIEE